MTVKELKEYLEIFDDNALVIIDYQCNDDWYNYYGSEIILKDNENNCVLSIVQ